LVSEALADATGRRPGLPLFTTPVLDDPALATALRALHASLPGPATALRRDELLTATIAHLVRRAATTPLPHTTPTRSRRTADQVRQLLHAHLRDDLTIDDLARSTGTTRYVVYRAFRTEYGMPPSDYQRQLRLRTARALIAAGTPLAEAAT